MAIDKAVQSAVIAAARGNGMQPAALLAVVEIESAGQLWEDDGTTPRLLFERHVFHREIKKSAPGKLPAAIKAGLAIPKWSKATQYKDQGTSKGRLALIAKARSIDLECANRSASWGLGQTMGFNAEGLKFQSATALVSYMETGGIPAQVDCMVREIKRNKLEKKLSALDWAGFARGYNGPGYAQNKYDTKLEAAYGRWEKKVGSVEAPPVAAPAVEAPRGDKSAEIKEVQEHLKALGYHDVGEVDGKWGGKTAGAIAAFKNDRHLTGETIIDPTLIAELERAREENWTRPIAKERAMATAAELSPKLPEVQAAASAERMGFWASIGAAVTTAITGVSKFFGDAVEWLNPIKEFVGDLPWPVWVCGALILSGALYYISRRSGDAKNAATAAYQEGSRV